MMTAPYRTSAMPERAVTPAQMQAYLLAHGWKRFVVSSVARWVPRGDGRELFETDDFVAQELLECAKAEKRSEAAVVLDVVAMVLATTPRAAD